MLGIAWVVWAGLALLPAAAFAIVAWQAPAAPGVRGFVRRWGHGLVWLLLAASFALRAAVPTASGAANAIALAAGGLYLAFLWSLLSRRA